LPLLENADVVVYDSDENVVKYAGNEKIETILSTLCD